MKLVKAPWPSALSLNVLCISTWSVYFCQGFNRTVPLAEIHHQSIMISPCLTVAMVYFSLQSWQTDWYQTAQFKSHLTTSHSPKSHQIFWVFTGNLKRGLNNGFLEPGYFIGTARIYTILVTNGFIKSHTQCDLRYLRKSCYAVLGSFQTVQTAKSCNFLTKLLSGVFIVHSSLVEIGSLVPHIL